MTFLATRECACAENIALGQKRPPFCMHGNRYLTEAQLNPKPRKPLKQQSDKRKAEGRRPGLKKGKGFAASKAQQDKVRGLPCVNCGREASDSVAINPGHLLARGQGGCDDPLCVVPICLDIQGGCHRLFDNGELDLISKLIDRGYHAELAHMLHPHGLSPTEQVRRLSGDRWEFVEKQGVAA